MFFRNLSFIFISLLISACSSTNPSWRNFVSTIQHELSATPQQPSNTLTSGTLKLNAYGPGIHQNQYGQPVTLVPAGGGVPGEQLQIKPNAYGPGVHMDQYGRPVRERKWP